MKDANYCDAHLDWFIRHDIQRISFEPMLYSDQPLMEWSDDQEEER